MSILSLFGKPIDIFPEKKKLKKKLHEDIFVYLLENKKIPISDISSRFKIGGIQQTKAVLGEIKSIVSEYGYSLEVTDETVKVWYGDFADTSRSPEELEVLLSLLKTHFPKDISKADLQILDTALTETISRRKVYEFLSSPEQEGKEVQAEAIMKACDIVSKKVLDTLISEIQIKTLPQTGGQIIVYGKSYIFYTREKVESILFAEGKNLINKKRESEKMEEFFQFMSHTENIGVLVSEKTISQATNITYTHLRKYFPQVKQWLERSPGYSFIFIEGEGYFYGTKADIAGFMSSQKKKQRLTAKQERENEKETELNERIEELHTYFSNHQGISISFDTLHTALGMSKNRTRIILKKYEDTVDEREDGVHIFVKNKAGFFYGTQEQYESTKKVKSTTEKTRRTPTLQSKLLDFITNVENHGTLFSSQKLAESIGTNVGTLYTLIKPVQSLLPSDIIFVNIKKSGYIFGPQEVVDSQNREIQTEKVKTSESIKSPTISQKLFSHFKEYPGTPFTKIELCEKIGFSIKSFSAHMAGAYSLAESSGEKDLKLVHIYGVGYILGNEETIKKLQSPQIQEKREEKNSAILQVCELFESRRGSLLSREEISDIVGISKNYLFSIISEIRENLAGVNTQFELYTIDGKGYLYGTEEDTLNYIPKKANTTTQAKKVNNESLLITLFSENTGKILSKEDICSRLNIASTYFPQLLRNVRDTLSPGEEGYILETIRGKGYIYDTSENITKYQVQTEVTIGSGDNHKGQKPTKIKEPKIPREWARTKLEPHRLVPKFRTSETNYTDKFRDIAGTFSLTGDISSSSFDIDFVDKKIDGIALSNDEFYLGAIACSFPESSLAEIKTYLGVTYDDTLLKEYIHLLKATLNNKLKGILILHFNGEKMESLSQKQTLSKKVSRESELTAIESLILQFCESEEGLSEQKIYESLKDEPYPLQIIQKYIESLNKKIKNTDKKVIFLEDSKVFRVVSLSSLHQEKKPNAFTNLCTLLERKKGVLLTKEFFIKELGISEVFLRVLFSRIRQKLQQEKSTYVFQNIHGQGYVYGLPEDITKIHTQDIKGEKREAPRQNTLNYRKTESRKKHNGLYHGTGGSRTQPRTSYERPHIIQPTNGNIATFQKKREIPAPVLHVADYAVPEFTEENIKRILDAHPDIELENISFEKEEQLHFYLYLLTYRGKFISKSKLYEYLKLTPSLESELAIFQLKGTINNQLGLKQGNLHIQTGVEGFRIASMSSQDVVTVKFEGQKDSFIISKQQRSITYVDGGKTVTIPELNQEAFDVLSRLIESKSHTISMGRSGTAIGQPIDKILSMLNIPYIIKRIQAQGKLKMIHKLENYQTQKPEKQSIQA